LCEGYRTVRVDVAASQDWRNHGDLREGRRIAIYVKTVAEVCPEIGMQGGLEG
jgi:hypothetical protein